MTQLLRHGYHFSRGEGIRKWEEVKRGLYIVHICVSYLHVIKAMDSSALPAGVVAPWRPLPVSNQRRHQPHHHHRRRHDVEPCRRRRLSTGPLTLGSRLFMPLDDRLLCRCCWQNYLPCAAMLAGAIMSDTRRPHRQPTAAAAQQLPPLPPFTNRPPHSPGAANPSSLSAPAS